jgi:hypothetical protein
VKVRRVRSAWMKLPGKNCAHAVNLDTMRTFCHGFDASNGREAGPLFERCAMCKAIAGGKGARVRVSRAAIRGTE